MLSGIWSTEVIFSCWFSKWLVLYPPQLWGISRVPFFLTCWFTPLEGCWTIWLSNDVLWNTILNRTLQVSSVFMFEICVVISFGKWTVPTAMPTYDTGWGCPREQQRSSLAKPCPWSTTSSTHMAWGEFVLFDTLSFLYSTSKIVSKLETYLWRKVRYFLSR